MTNLARFEDSSRFSEVEKLALRLAVAMSRTPSDVPEPLLAALRTHLSEAQVVELVAEIAWENFRFRFNRPFDVGAQGFSAGAFCPLSDRVAARDLLRPGDADP